MSALNIISPMCTCKDGRKSVHSAMKPATYSPLPFKNSIWQFASFVFVLSIGANLFTAVLCLAYPPESRDHAASVPIPKSATCLRVTRHADYTTVDSIVGTPPVKVSLLLRLDSAVDANSTKKTTRLFTQDAVESNSVVCDADGGCSDVVMASDGRRNVLRRLYFSFEYSPAAVESSVASSLAGGEFKLKRGFAYWLTATHLCFDDTALKYSSPYRSEIRVDSSGSLHATQDQIRANPVLAQIPAAGAGYVSDCSRRENVSLFPVSSAVETPWLSITDSGLYNSEPDAVKVRRDIVEIGATCAANISKLARALVLYKLDCTYLTCRYGRSLPFRRVASASMFVDLRVVGSEWMNVQLDHTLDSLPKLADSDSAFYASLLKMVMITLAASVVYVRSKRVTASSSWLLRNCISISRNHGSIASTVEGSITNNAEDRIVGFVAFTARGIVAGSRFDRLSYDGQVRACVSELVATAASAIHWIIRYTRVLIPDNNEPPISKLGGSTAIVDSTAAVMMAFSESPTMTAADGQFDPTARMLVSLLIATVVLSRCAFSAACCGSLWSKFKRDPDCAIYASLLFYSSFSWCLQSAALAVNMCDLFVAPATYSMSRSIEGGTLFIRTSVFFAIVCAGLPRMMVTLTHMLRNEPHVD